MNIYITLDYELFFGDDSGDLNQCIIHPTNELVKVLDKHKIKAVFFVDVGYLVKLLAYKNDFPKLNESYNLVSAQIKKLADDGHGIELHIHPHWEDTIYDGNKWVFNATRYKLTDFTKKEIFDIVTKYKNVLESISQRKIIAYRAGGWSIQPFEYIGDALAKNNIFIDSTVYPNGYYNSKFQKFDFRNTPVDKTKWQFSTDPAIEDSKGVFTEIPISSIKVSPLFFWKFAVTKIIKQKKHLAYGNGNAIKLANSQIKKLLLKPSYTVVSIDGYKAMLLNKSLKKYNQLNNKQTNLVLIGHPKAFSSFSLNKLNSFIINSIKKHKFIIFK